MSLNAESYLQVIKVVEKPCCSRARVVAAKSAGEAIEAFLFDLDCPMGLWKKLRSRNFHVLAKRILPKYLSPKHVILRPEVIYARRQLSD